MGLRFEWHPPKARSNLQKHGVAFEEAASAFADPLSLTIPDPAHSEEEARYILLGTTRSGRLVVVVHVEREERIRILSARKATHSERKTYEEEA